MIAAARLTDPGLAAEALAVHKRAAIRAILVGQVTDTHLLSKVATTDPDDRVRAAAQARLKALAGRPSGPGPS